eukprot:XP_011663811.1 PREDICTED: serine protease 27-like [Strongylocentrotus purpuratus]
MMPTTDDVEPEMEGDGPMMMGAKNAMEGEFPWQAAIFLNSYKVCSAALIHEEWLLTSASCLPFLYPDKYKVVVGTTSVIMSDTMAADHPNMQYSMVKEFYVHPDYDARRWAHDVALVKIETAFVLNDYVNVICLPIPTMQGHFHGGVKATVAAFGNPMMKMEPQCPDVEESAFGICTESCTSDEECQDNEGKW